MDKNKPYLHIISVVSLVVFFVVALLLSFYGLGKVGLIELPFIEQETEPITGNENKIDDILNSLANSEKTEESVYLILDSSVVKDVLATGKVTNNYLHEYSITYGEDKGSVEYSVLRKNSDFHMLEFKNGQLMSEVLCLFGTAYVFDARLNQRNTLVGLPDDFFEKSTGSISAIDLINFVINFHKGTPVMWKLGTVNDCTVEAVREESVNMARITLKYSDHTDIYMLDIDRSALYSYETYVGDVRTVSMKTTKISYDIEGLELDSVLD